MPHALDDPLHAEPRVLSSRNLELIMAANLIHSTHPNLVGFEAAWKQRQRQELSKEATRYLGFAEQGLEWATLSLCDCIPLSGILDDWTRFRSYVEAQPIDEFLYVAFNCDIPRAELPQLRLEPDRVDSWVPKLSCFSRMKAPAAVTIFSDPEAFRAQLLAYVEGNRTQAFATRLEERRPRIEQRIKGVQDRLKGKDPITVAEELSGKPFRHPRDFQTYTFAPSHYIGPRHFFSWGEGNFLMAFSLGQTEEAAGDQARQLSERMKVLGDRTRLDILHLLGEGPSYGKAIADRLELTTATVSRQLDQLKEAGLVTEDRADSTNIKLVHLRTTALNELLGEVQGFLGARKN